MVFSNTQIRSLIFLVAIGLGVFSFLSISSTAASQEILNEKTASNYGLDRLVVEIEEVHCLVGDEELLNLKLTPDNIKKKKEFCSLSSAEKKQILINEFQKLDNSGVKQGIISGYQNSYSCYFDGLNTGIPTYADLGLSSSSCSWTDPSPVCKSQGGVACMWGCTNKDPKLTWKTKTFASKAALENEIKPKGYYQANTGYYSGLSYTRQLPYGYRYEVQGPSSGSGSFASEGPEPDPGFNWYAFTNGWYPVEAGLWHLAC